MKNKTFKLQVLHTRSSPSVTGLTTGDARDDLVHPCKYRLVKAMCRLLDIHATTETHQ